MPLFSVLLLLCVGVIFSVNSLTITTPQELNAFSTSVNSGNNYSGEIVYLGSDLGFTPDLSSRFVPIGNESNHFSGTFDGQGHIINNLDVNTPLQHVGLFGYSKEAIIKDVVIDSSCSIVNSRNSRSDTGSITGYCESCIIENIVNMGSVTFSGSSGRSSVFTGGIIGRLLYSSTVRNCVNYGSVIQSGDATDRGVSIGGIVGTVAGSGTKSIHNCANYGTLISNGTTPSTLYMGGIVGNSWAGTVSIENCVSGGNILNITSSVNDNYFGTNVGYVETNTTIIHCLWTGGVGCDTVYDYDEEEPEASITVTNSSLVELNTATMNELNTYASKNSTWSKWFMLHLNGGTINSGINQKTLIVTQKHFPDPVKEGSTFSFWCTDAECTEKYDPKTAGMSKISDLYAAWDKYTLTFIFNNSENDELRLTNYNDTIAYPEDPVKEGYKFNGWDNNITVMPAHNINITAQWDKITEVVEIVFWKKDIKEGEIKEIINKYSNEKNFIIEKVEIDEETGEIKAIIKFNDKKAAENFVENINQSSDSATKNVIKKVGFIVGPINSFSVSFYPFLTSFLSFFYY